MSREGTHRQTLRRLVAEAKGDPMRAEGLFDDWWRSGELEGGDDFLRSVTEEFGAGEATVSPEVAGAVGEAWTAAEGDEARFEAILRERIDHRENPSFRAMLERGLADPFFRQARKALQEEIERYHDDEAGSGIGDDSG